MLSTAFFARALSFAYSMLKVPQQHRTNNAFFITFSATDLAGRFWIAWGDASRKNSPILVFSAYR